MKPLGVGVEVVEVVGVLVVVVGVVVGVVGDLVVLGVLVELEYDGGVIGFLDGAAIVFDRCAGI
jgi:hypothetical protein